MYKSISTAQITIAIQYVNLATFLKSYVTTSGVKEITFTNQFIIEYSFKKMSNTGFNAAKIGIFIKTLEVNY